MEGRTHTNFTEWIGIGCGDGENPTPWFNNDDELWSD